MGFYTRTKQPIIGDIAEALGFSNNTLEVGTNLEVDGGIFANSLSVFRSRVELEEQLIIGNTTDGFYREITNNQEIVWLFENYPRNVFKTIYGYDDLDDSFILQREGSNAKIRNNVKSFTVNGQEVITNIQAVINNGTPQLNLKQGYENNIVRTCDLTPVLSNVPAEIEDGMNITNITYDGTYYYGDVNASLDEIRAFILKHNRFSLSTKNQAIFTLSKYSTNNLQPFPATYFVFHSITDTGTSFLTIYGELNEDTQEYVLKMKVN